MNPTRLALVRPVTICMFVGALILMGLISFQYLPVQQLPTVSFNFVSVVISLPGATPDEMEQSVTLPVENALSGISGISNMSGSSSNGTSRVSLQLAAGADVNTVADDVAQAVGRIQGRLPTGIGTPQIVKANPNATPIMNLAFTGAPLDQLYSLATNQLAPDLQQVLGVASVSVNGGLIPQVSVTVDPQALAAYGVSLTQVTNAINTQNVSVPGGITTEGGKVLTVSTDAYFQSVSQLQNLVVASPGGTPVTLGQVATVKSGTAPIDQFTHLDGKDAVGLVVTAQSGANIVAVDDAVKKELAKLTPTLPPGVRYSIINDQTVYTHQSLLAVEEDLALAVILPSLVLLLFLHRFRNMLIVVLAIPTSLISSFIVMHFLGFSLDLISLLALSLLTGILVDDSVVVLENINRHLGLGKKPFEAALEGRMEIGLAAVAITLTDVVVYLPVAFTTGLVGEIFKEFGLTIVAATLFSLFVSFTLTPLLASKWLKEPMDLEDVRGSSHHGFGARFAAWWERGYGRLRAGYGRLIDRALRHRPLVVLIGVGALAFSLAFLPLGWVGTEFTPQEDNSQFSVNVSMPNGTPLDITQDYVTRLDDEIRAMPGVVQTYATAGVRGGFGGGATSTSGNIAVDLLPVGQRPAINSYINRVRALSSQFPSANIITNISSPLRIGGQRDVGVVLQGPDIKTLDQVATQVAQVMRAQPGVTQVRDESAQAVPELSVQVNRAAAANLGVTANQVGSAVSTAITGSTVNYLRPNGSTVQTPIVVGLADGSTMTPQRLEQLPIVTTSGGVIHLGQVANVTLSSQPAQLNDQNRQLEVSVSAAATDVPLGTVAAEIQQAIATDVAIPPGYSYTLNGAAQQQSQVFAPLEAAFALAIILVYMLASALYESLLYPLAVLLGLPLATFGAFLALAVTHETLNLYSFMGLIMLTGLVAKNAILLVDYTNTLRKRGYPRWDALVEAGRTRLRPILMTTCTMTFAMIPLALKIGAGSEERSPMATLLIGGLITSTLLTLVFIPVIYSYLDDLGMFLARLGWVALPFAPAGATPAYATNGTVNGHVPAADGAALATNGTAATDVHAAGATNGAADHAAEADRDQRMRRSGTGAPEPAPELGSD